MSKGMRSVSFLVVLALAWASSSQAELVLVEDGVSLAPIVVFEDAPRFTRMAADELAEYIEKVSGARPDVVEGEPDPLPERAIWVGYQPELESLFPEIDFDFQHPEEILIAASARHLVIAGRDRWDPERNVRLLSRGRTLEGVQLEYGTVNAVYTFIQDYLHVRWLWPGSHGEDIVEQPTIRFEPVTFRFHPQIRGRIGLFTRRSLSRLGFRGHDAQQAWVRRQRLLFDSLNVPGGHAYTDWWERFHETHPEYFALQPDGTRGGGEAPYPRASTVKLCHSNPAVWQQWLADVEEQIARDPTRTVFNASPNDSGASGHCVCADCLAWDHPEGERLRFIWQGVSQEYVALSDRTITYANTVARMLKERYPDKDYFVRVGAYGNYRPPPVEAVPADNVILVSVTNFHNRPAESRIGNRRELFKAWAEVAPHIFWRPNLGYGLWNIGFPRVAPRRAIEDMRLAGQNNVTGLYFDRIWDHWATQGLNYYMLAQMAWNPNADGEAILEDYYQRGFGKAADHVKAYWTKMEEANERLIPDKGSWTRIYDLDFLDGAEAHLGRAMEALADEPEIYRQRVGFLRHGLDYARAIVEVNQLMDRFRETGDSDFEDDARALWVERIRPLMDSDEYPYALNAGVRPGHSRGFRSLGLFPFDLENRW